MEKACDIFDNAFINISLYHQSNYDANASTTSYKEESGRKTL